MKRALKILLALGVVAIVGAAAYQPLQSWWRARWRPNFRTAAVARGNIMEVVNATGTVKPMLSVKVGAVVSGPIAKLYVDFNDLVKKGDLLAKIDTRIYDAGVARDKAALASRRAEINRVKAQLQQSANDENRAKNLRKENSEFISESEMDQITFKRIALEAELIVAETAVESAQANLDNSKANLEYAKITSPVDGLVIERKVDEGQSLASSFQTPELFTIAPDMDKKMHVYASVDEADVGLIRGAKERGEPVHFTVDAYPNDLFTGKIEQIRLSSTTTQNVVTYPVIVAAPNTELKLLPGMTANLSFQIEERKQILKLPNSALRFYPDLNLVRPEDKELLEGTKPQKRDEQQKESPLSADEKAQANRDRHRRHVWVLDGDYLRAVPVVTGISDSKYTELVEGELNEDDELIVAIQRTPVK